MYDVRNSIHTCQEIDLFGELSGVGFSPGMCVCMCVYVCAFMVGGLSSTGFSPSLCVGVYVFMYVYMRFHDLCVCAYCVCVYIFI